METDEHRERLATTSRRVRPRRGRLCLRRRRHHLPVTPRR